MMNSNERELLSCDLEEMDDRLLELIDYKEMKRKSGADDGGVSTSTLSKADKGETEGGVQKEDEEKEEDSPPNITVLMDPSLPVSLPSRKEIEFNLTCATCYEYSGPPEFACPLGHIICSDCYHKLEDQKCQTQLNDIPDDDVTEDHNTYDCGRKVEEIPEFVKATPYYQQYLKEATFTCGAFEMGCDKMEIKGEEIAKHELEECKFRTLRFCQFNSLGCSKRFTSFGANIIHLIEAHKIPVSKGGEGHFHIPYDRAGFGESRVEEHFGIVPVIRAVVVVAQKLVCVLAVKELEEENMTRIWVSYLGHLGKGEYLKATLCIVSSTENEELGGKYAIEMHLPVLQAVTTISDLESTECYIDVNNDYLDKEMCVEHDGEKCLDLMLSIKKASTGVASDDDDNDMFRAVQNLELEKKASVGVRVGGGKR